MATSRAVVIADHEDVLDPAEIATGQWQPGQVALRVDPTPNASGKDRFAEDVLLALRRRPRAAARWSDGPTPPRDAAWIWCAAHGIEHIVVARAHTIPVEQIRALAIARPTIDHPDGIETTWWLIDGSPDGRLVREIGAAVDATGTWDELKRCISDDQRHADELGSRESDVTHQHGIAMRDAHPAVFARHLERTLPAQASSAAVERFEAVAALIASPDKFRSLAAALFYVLSNAEDPSDALLIWRAAQLGRLLRRAGLSMRASPWVAAEDAREEIARRAECLLAYSEPLYSCIGALAIEGLDADAMVGLTIRRYVPRERTNVSVVQGFHAMRTDGLVAQLIRGQQIGGERLRKGEQRTLLVRTADKNARWPRGVALTPQRVNAVIGTMEIEQDLDLSVRDWLDRHQIGN